MVLKEGNQRQQLKPVNKGCPAKEVRPGYRNAGRTLFQELWSARFSVEQQSTDDRWIGSCIRVNHPVRDRFERNSDPMGEISDNRFPPFKGAPLVFGQLSVVHALMKLLMKRSQLSPSEFPGNTGLRENNRRPMSFSKQL